MKRSSSIFKLKKNYKRLEVDDYAHNLRVYFGCLSSVNTISSEQLSYILTGLNAACHVTDIDTSEQPVEPALQQKFYPETLIAGVWSDEVDSNKPNTDMAYRSRRKS